MCDFIPVFPIANIKPYLTPWRIVLEKPTGSPLVIFSAFYGTRRSITMNFVVALCINNIRHFIVQLIHTNYKILGLLK